MDNLERVIKALKELGYYNEVENYLKGQETFGQPMKLYGQREMPWADDKIGKSNSLIYYYGCTISSVAMLSSWYGCDHDPGWMAKNLRFSNDLILWQSITEKLCFKWVWRQYGRNEQKIDASLGGKTTSCILQINGGHWVVVVGKEGNNYRIADPYTKTYRTIYKNIITGSSHFDSK